MRVALDVRYRVDSGASTYIRAIVPHLMEVAAGGTEFLYVRYCSQALRDLPDAPSIEAPLGSGLRDLAWTNTTLPQELDRRGVDIYHGLKLFGPLRSRVPMVQTVHSITRRRHGEFPMSIGERAIHAYGNVACRRSCRVIAVSEYVSDFLTQDLGIPAARIRTAYLGVPDTFQQAVAQAHPSSFDTSALAGAPYVVCVGNVEYVKNHATAVRALGRIRSQVPHHLVIAGRADKPAARDLRRVIDSEGLTDRVHLAGFLDVPTLAACLLGADLQVHPALSEGFCLAVLEGMYAGLPVICTDIPALREVVGDAGAMIRDPKDSASLAKAMLRWLSNPAAARAAALRARARAEMFDWEKSARKTLDVYRECLDAGCVRSAAG